MSNLIVFIIIRIDLSSDDGEDTQSSSKVLDPYLQAKREKEQGERARRMEEERVMERLSREMGLDEEDPMRDYYIKRELKRARKEGDGHKHRHHHKSEEDERGRRRRRGRREHE